MFGSVCFSRAVRVGLLACVLAAVSGPAVRARPRLDSPTIIVGFHIAEPLPGDALRLPRAPDELNLWAPAPGTYDVWLLVFTREPLVGAWTLSTGLNYDPGAGRGLDLLEWQNLADGLRPHGAWPAPGEGNGADFVWERKRCWDIEHRLVRGRDGWWYQPACRLRVRLYDPDSLTLANPEPGVLPAEVECYDEGHDLDGSDNWTAVVPAYFGIAGRPSEPLAPRGRVGPARSASAERPVSWSQLKRWNREP